MNQHEWLMLSLAGLIVLAAWIGVGLFSPSAKLRRRRRKSHTRIESTSNRPAVRFSVRSPRK
jgi:hypothetical protein